MPLETRAKLAAEKLLLLTESLNDAVLNARSEEIDGILTSRQLVLDQLGTMDIDSAAAALLSRVQDSELDLITLLRRSQSETTAELASLLSGSQKARVYKSPPKQGRLLQTG